MYTNIIAFIEYVHHNIGLWTIPYVRYQMPSASLKTTGLDGKVVNAPSVLFEWTHRVFIQNTVKIFFISSSSCVVFEIFLLSVELQFIWTKIIIITNINKNIKFYHNEGVYCIVYVFECCIRSSSANKPAIRISTRMLRQRFDLLCTKHGTRVFFNFFFCFIFFVWHFLSKIWNFKPKWRQFSANLILFIFIGSHRP